MTTTEGTFVVNRQSYPVFVEQSVVHMIWVDADSPEHAAKQVNEYPGDYNRKLQSCDPVDGWLTARAPTEEIGPYDWDAVYGYTGGADEHDHHVTLHRIHLAEQKRAAHAELGHPGVTDRELDGKRWCPECSWWVEAAEAVSAR